MTILDLIDDAIEQRQEHDLRITKAYLKSFRVMSLKDKKTAFLALAEPQQRELLGFFSVAELQAVKAKLEE